MEYALAIGTPPAAEPIGSAELKRHLRVNSTAEDAEIIAKAKSARALVEDWTGRQLMQATWDMWFDRFPEGTDEIAIPKPPLQSVTHVQYYDEAGTLQTFGTGNYFVDAVSAPGRLRLTDGAAWPATQNRRPNAVNVRFVAGYGTGTAETGVPENARDAIKLITADLFAHREARLDAPKVEDNPQLKALLWPLRAWMPS